MALITPDFTEVKDPVEPGTYKVNVKKGEIKTSQGGTTLVRWQFETFDEADPKNNGRIISAMTPVSGGGAFRLRDLYMACMGSKLAGEFDTEVLVGKSLAVEVVDGVDWKTKEPTGYTEVSRFKSLNM